MIAIYKYEIEPAPLIQQVESFEGAEIVSCGTDGYGRKCIWVRVDTKRASAPLKYFCIGTGWEYSDVEEKYDLEYVDYIINNHYIWHVFKVKK